MQRDMREFEEKAAASAKSTEYERNHDLQLENDLKKVYAELEDEKKTVAHNKKIAERAIKDLNVGLDRCRTGIKVMIQRIFGKLCHFSILYFNCKPFALLILIYCNPSRLNFSKDEIRNRPADE